MAVIRTALVVGGGIAGMSACIQLRRLGVATCIIDLDPQWRVYGAGITITAATLRALGTLGVLDQVLAQGFAGRDLRVCQVDGSFVQDIETPANPGEYDPGTGGILRPTLHRILSERTKAHGTDVRLGLSVASLEQGPHDVGVIFTDGSTGRFDLVIGADGVFSTMRGLLFPDAPKPRYTGQVCWRLMVRRPPEIDRRHYFLGGPVKVGLTPVSQSEMYMFLLQYVAEPQWMEARDQHVILGGLMQGFGGVLAQVRAELSPDSRIVYRPLEAVLLQRPWFRGRCVLIGDAVHATTPQLASGAGLSIEDAIVLVDELAQADDLEAALSGFMERRWERCRAVVENSLEIGRLEVAGAPVAEQTALVERSLAILAAPI